MVLRGDSGGGVRDEDAGRVGGVGRVAGERVVPDVVGQFGPMAGVQMERKTSVSNLSCLVALLNKIWFRLS